MNQPDLPEPIAAYFAADASGAALIDRCFSKQAVVKDEGRTHNGRQAIKAWKTAASAQYQYTVKPLSIEQSDGRHTVTGRVSGNFPGSPIDLRYVFELKRGKINFLEIAP